MKTNFVSGVNGIRIRRILTKGDAMGFLISCNLGPGHTKKRPVDFQSALDRQWFHSTQSGGAASTKKVKKTRLHLIIRMVGQQD